MPVPQRARLVLAALCAGLMAAGVALLAPTFSRSLAQDRPELAPGGIGVLTREAPQGFTGTATCASCHAAQTKAWLTSHHAAAMARATPETVKGDFANVTVEAKGARARFFRDGPRFMVETDGKDGKTTVFEITHSFGITPLQQYLVTFPDGRLQPLPFAFDTRPKAEGGQRWYHLYPDAPPTAADPLHWTRTAQNWNFMCAECHSTAVRKGYDAAADRFHTTFSEISVGCESCHGAGAGHVAWAQSGQNPQTPDKGFASTAAKRPAADFAPDPATGSPARGVARMPGDEEETCARCHARRGIVSEHWTPGHPLTDTHRPAVLSAGLFEADGQMLDEVFNDHAFKQSLMYAKGVVCSDCHDPHSARLKAEGAQVCAQCHLPDKFASAAHTGHAPGPKAPDCISCHMPARTYMGVDVRHDHSFRIPRPDLSARFGTPNACNTCHAERTASWAAEAVARWHGPERKGFQSWTEAFHRARAGEPAARDLLIRLARDPMVPAVARATAVNEMQRFPSAATEAALTAALADPDPMVRVAALGGLAGAPLDVRWRRAGDLLSDPSPLVRMEAASLLADTPLQGLAEAERRRLDAAVAEYVAAQTLNADRPEGRANLAGLLARRGDLKGAEVELQAGLRRDPDAMALAVNLADLYRVQSREREAEEVLRRSIALTDSADAWHALGLSLVRQKRSGEALNALQKAARLSPDNARYAYVAAVALQSAGQAGEARQAAADALARSPYDTNLLSFALQDALRARDLARAAPLAQRLADMVPDNAEIARLAAQLKGR